MTILNDTIPTVTCEGSQDNEDHFLRKILPGDGMYIDIGASFPKECSNTWRLYQRGWRGLLVEPLPQCWYGLLRQRPGDYLLPVACSNANGSAKLRAFHTVSSLRPDWPIDSQCDIVVDTLTLASILDLFPDIRSKARLLSIDVEGYEKQVLEGNDWSTFKPQIIVLEYRLYDKEKPGVDISHEWTPILCHAGYRHYQQTDLNQIWELI